MYIQYIHNLPLSKDGSCKTTCRHFSWIFQPYQKGIQFFKVSQVSILSMLVLLDSRSDSSFLAVPQKTAPDHSKKRNRLGMNKT